MRTILIKAASSLCLALLPLASSLALSTPAPEAAIEQSTVLRQQGKLLEALDLLKSARTSASTPETRARAAGALGASYLQAQQFGLAESALKEAYDFFSGAERAPYALALGNLAFMQKDNEAATRYYREAQSLAGSDTEIGLNAALNLARVAPPEQRLAQLNTLAQRLDVLERGGNLTRQHLNLGTQARQLGAAGTALAYRELEKARIQATQAGKPRLQIEALDSIAQLYEERGRSADALTLSRQALDLAQSEQHGTVADLLINLEWRLARLYGAQNRRQDALAAYQRALSHIELVRQDIPVVYEDGRSSFRTTLEPIYLGFVDLQLRQLDGQTPDPQSPRLRNVIDTMELIKQTELQDFLGDRCAVEAIQGVGGNQVPPGTAVLYPILLQNRVELLLRTSTGIERSTVNVNTEELGKVATSFAAALRAGDPNYLGASQQLYGWLLKPIEPAVAAQEIKQVVVVPDGVLRLVPMAALNDGKEYAIEKYAISMATGLSVTNTSRMRDRKVQPLLAGVSEPGQVVDKLGPLLAAQIVTPGAGRGLAQTRSLRAIAPDTPEPAATASSEDAVRTQRKLDKLRARLALPGVKEEIKSLNGILGGTSLLDGDFTVDHFRQDAESGEYRIVHMASHGVFGGTPETSFIMAHDDVISMNGLQTLLKAEKFQKNPIELLTLSACQTAEGNDRAPLGIAGAAIKARAKSVMGTLWPVEDTAARSIMESFYTGLTRDKLSKTEALRQAQVQLIRQSDTEHPFFWAPFVLIGNWQ